MENRSLRMNKFIMMKCMILGISCVMGESLSETQKALNIGNAIDANQLLSMLNSAPTANQGTSLTKSNGVGDLSVPGFPSGLTLGGNNGSSIVAGSTPLFSQTTPLFSQTTPLFSQYNADFQRLFGGNNNMETQVTGGGVGQNITQQQVGIIGSPTGLQQQNMSYNGWMRISELANTLNSLTLPSGLAVVPLADLIALNGTSENASYTLTRLGDGKFHSIFKEYTDKTADGIRNASEDIVNAGNSFTDRIKNFFGGNDHQRLRRQLKNQETFVQKIKDFFNKIRMPAVRHLQTSPQKQSTEQQQQLLNAFMSGIDSTNKPDDMISSSNNSQGANVTPAEGSPFAMLPSTTVEQLSSVEEPFMGQSGSSIFNAITNGGALNNALMLPGSGANPMDLLPSMNLLQGLDLTNIVPQQVQDYETSFDHVGNNQQNKGPRDFLSQLNAISSSTQQHPLLSNSMLIGNNGSASLLMPSMNNLLSGLPSLGGGAGLAGLNVSSGLLSFPNLNLGNNNVGSMDWAKLTNGLSSLSPGNAVSPNMSNVGSNVIMPPDMSLNEMARKFLSTDSATSSNKIIGDSSATTNLMDLMSQGVLNVRRSLQSTSASLDSLLAALTQQKSSNVPNWSVGQQQVMPTLSDGSINQLNEQLAALTGQLSSELNKFQATPNGLNTLSSNNFGQQLDDLSEQFKSGFNQLLNSKSSSNPTISNPLQLNSQFSSASSTTPDLNELTKQLQSALGIHSNNNKPLTGAGISNLFSRRLNDPFAALMNLATASNPLTSVLGGGASTTDNNALMTALASAASSNPLMALTSGNNNNSSTSAAGNLMSAYSSLIPSDLSSVASTYQNMLAQAVSANPLTTGLSSLSSSSSNPLAAFASMMGGAQNSSSASSALNALNAFNPLLNTGSGSSTNPLASFANAGSMLTNMSKFVDAASALSNNNPLTSLTNNNERFTDLLSMSTNTSNLINMMNPTNSLASLAGLSGAGAVVPVAGGTTSNTSEGSRCYKCSVYFNGCGYCDCIDGEPVNCSPSSCTVMTGGYCAVTAAA